jgi:hypothetical protein
MNQGNSERIVESLQGLEAHLLQEQYRGYDPYDALTSPVFRLPGLRSARWIRLAAVQALKRAPYNLRPALGIRKGYNPVTLAFVLEGSAYRAQHEQDSSGAYHSRALELIDELERLRSGGGGWGYDFPWEARYGSLPARMPTIVATGIVSNALFASYRILGLEKAFALCREAAQFVLNDLPRLPGPEGSFCWGYFPGDGQRVLNATMKGAKLCAQVYAVTGDEAYLRPATETVTYVATHQREDGSWPYAVGDRRSWTDSFHTAYVLDAFDTYQRCSGDSQFSEVLRRGWHYYRENFFTHESVPKYYSDRLFPLDATVCAQSILTLCRFGDDATAARVAEWAIDNMQCPDGHFAYQKRRRRLVRIPYMRWSSAYMYLALSKFLYARSHGAGEL